MEIMVDGRQALLHAGPKASVGLILRGIRHWARSTGRRIQEVRLDGKELAEADLARCLAEAPEEGSVLEIRTEDPNARLLPVLRKASDVLPGARLDLGFAARSLRVGDTGPGLEALFQAIQALSLVEMALRAMQREAATTADAEASSGDGDDPDPLEELRRLLHGVRDAMQAQDLDAVADLIREHGLGALGSAYEHIQADIDRRVAESSI